MKKICSIFVICLGLILLSQQTTYASISSIERVALIALYNSTTGANWADNSGWLGVAGTECSWYGVYCDGDGIYVHEIDLYSNNLTGTIPVEIGNLTNLDYLDLGDNQLTGAIPAQIKNLTNLTILWLEDNQLTGTIPVEIGNLTNLELLSLYFNNLTGTIPVEIGNLTYLTDLWLDFNQLTGIIPVEIGNLSNLTDLDLSSNQLIGPIPSQIGNLINLKYLWLGYNQLTGAIPAELMNLVSLSDTNGLSLCGNSLYTSDTSLRDFLNQYQDGGDWESCQDAITDTDGDGIPDDIEDANQNDIVDEGETNPNNPDTDGDGILDGIEDANRNGIIDPGETDPLDPDSDDDGFTDKEEIICGSDPNDSVSRCSVGLPWLMLLLGD